MAARFACAVSVFLCSFLLSSVRSEFPDAAAIRLPSDRPSDADESNHPKLEEVTVDFPLPTPESVQGSEAVPIEVSLIPVRRAFPYPRHRVTNRPLWRRLGHHCHHHMRHGGIPQGAIIPYGDDMVVPEGHLRRIFGDRRQVFPAGEMLMEAEQATGVISVEELFKQKEMGAPREYRRFPRFHPERNHEKGDGGLVKHFLHFLNRH